MSNTYFFNQRIYTDFYDSVNQRKRTSLGHFTNEILLFYIGRLRLDILLSEILVLTDNQILDGSFFLQVEPEDLLLSLARSRRELFPIEIRARASCLDDALVSFVKLPNQETLRGFSFSSIAHEATRSNVQEVLRQTYSNQVSSWRDISKILKSSQVDDALVERLERSWAKWIEAQNSLLKGRVFEWDRRQFNLDANIFLAADRYLQALKTEEGKRLAQWVNETRNRSLLDGQLSQLRQKASSDLLSDLNLIEVWFNYAYNLTIAMQHGCKTFESVVGSYQNRLEGLKLIDETTPEIAEFSAPFEFVFGLGNMPNDQFQNLYETNANSFRLWWEKGDADALRRGLEPYLETTINSQASSHLRAALAQGFIGALGGLVAGPLTGALIGICTFLLVDQIGEKVLSKKERIMNRIIHYADARKTH